MISTIIRLIFVPVKGSINEITYIDSRSFNP